MTLTTPNTVILGDNNVGSSATGSYIYSMVGYETNLDFPTRNLVLQHMFSTSKGMHAYSNPLVFAACTVLTPNN